VLPIRHDQTDGVASGSRGRRRGGAHEAAVPAGHHGPALTGQCPAEALGIGVPRIFATDARGTYDADLNR
jgi:hypothetical protein